MNTEQKQNEWTETVRRMCEEGDPRHDSPQAQHSPLPWHISTNAAFPESAAVFADGELVSTAYCMIADAKLIVRAVNHAEKLAEALRDVMADLDHYVSTHGPGPDKRRDAAKQALAAYESDK